MKDEIIRQLNRLEELILQDEYETDLAIEMIDRIRDLAGGLYED